MDRLPEGLTMVAEQYALRDKFRKILINKLTEKDLEELRFYLEKERTGGHVNAEYRQKFEWKLRQYFHEEVLRREIASIEALLETLRPEDLKK